MPRYGRRFDETDDFAVDERDLSSRIVGIALAAFIDNADAAQPVILAVFLPLSFISGIFIPLAVLPHWLADIGKVFPIYPFAAALIAAYNPHTTGSG